jgi:hypothetical protein
LDAREANGKFGLRMRENGDVYVERDLVVFGNKKFAQPHPADPEKAISYVALEGPEAGIYTRRTARLAKGEAVVELPEHFSLVTGEEGLTVAVSPLDEWLQLYVAEKSTRRIAVREVHGKTGRFDYLVQGIRKGHERLEVISTRR